LAQERFQAAVDDLLERSRGAADDLIERGRQGAEDIRELVRVELRRQVKALGLVTRDDLARFAARLGVGRAPAKKSSDGQKATGAKKAPGVKKAGGAKKVGTAKKAGGAKKAPSAVKTTPPATAPRATA